MNNLFYYIIIICLVAVGCVNKNNSTTTQEEEKAKQFSCIIFPDSLEFNCCIKSEYTILVLLETNCPECLSELQGWESILQKKEMNSCIYFIVHGVNQSFIHYLTKQERLKNNVVMDQDNLFLTANNFLFEGDRTIIVNSNNEIIAQGSILSPNENLSKVLDYIYKDSLEDIKTH
ncbi:MAG: hypothetical protein PWP52_1214 [Bacteroidales bacterium]|nr:hypothetical protein [Bacteroidales bacterium]